MSSPKTAKMRLWEIENDTTLEEFIAAYWKAGEPRSTAALRAGIHPQTLRNWEVRLGLAVEETITVSFRTQERELTTAP